MELDQARTLARDLMDAHGLAYWTFEFDRAKRRAGQCNFNRRLISLSRHLTVLHEEREVRNTIMHEIAHALAGPRAGHGPQWRAQAVKIGATPERLMRQDVPMPPAPWEGRCPAGHTHRRYRRPKNPVSCSLCCPTFCLANLIQWEHEGWPADLGPAYERALLISRRRASATCPRCGAAAA